MNKKQQEEMSIVTWLEERANNSLREQRDLYLCSSRQRIKELNKLTTLCSLAGVELKEDIEWTKWGTNVTGRSVANCDLKKIKDEIEKMKKEIEKGKKIKKQWATTSTGEITYAKSAIKEFGLRNSNESYQDAAERLAYVAS